MGMKFDLLGDPIPENHGKPGANGHTANAKTASKIRVLLVSGMKLGRIAAEVGLSAPTLRKHYFQNGKVNYRLAREAALAESRAKNLMLLQGQADDGNVSAIKEMHRQIERAEIDMLDREAGGKRNRAAPAPGKKERERAAALQGEDELDEFFRRENVH